MKTNRYEFLIPCTVWVKAKDKETAIVKLEDLVQTEDTSFYTKIYVDKIKRLGKVI